MVIRIETLDSGGHNCTNQEFKKGTTKTWFIDEKQKGSQQIILQVCE
jgi:hypothetical protein